MNVLLINLNALVEASLCVESLLIVIQVLVLLKEAMMLCFSNLTVFTVKMELSKMLT